MCVSGESAHRRRLIRQAGRCADSVGRCSSSEPLRWSGSGTLVEKCQLKSSTCPPCDSTAWLPQCPSRPCGKPFLKPFEVILPFLLSFCFGFFYYFCHSTSVFADTRPVFAMLFMKRMRLCSHRRRSAWKQEYKLTGSE